jgi:hypothetical protein
LCYGALGSTLAQLIWLRAIAKQLGGGDLMDKLNPNGVRGICTAPCALSSQAIAQGNNAVIFMLHAHPGGLWIRGWLEHLLITTLPTR